MSISSNQKDESKQSSSIPSACRPWEQQSPCLILIGMAGAGKTTIAKALSQAMSWPHADTDALMEAWFGVRLEEVRNRLGVKQFLKAEEDCILRLKLSRCIVSTGGSVIYSPKAMHKLQELGLIINLQAEYHTIAERINRFPDRGIAMAPGQTLEDLYWERYPIYEKYADLTVQTDKHNPQKCAQLIQELMHEKEQKFGK